MHPYFSEKAFRRYEDTIELVVKNFPNAVTINPEPLAAITFSCRFRDAMRGFLQNKYHSRIDYDKFSAIHPEIVTALRDKFVVIGKKSSIDSDVKPVSVGTVLRAEVLLASETIESPDEEVIKALCLLASKQVLQSITLSGVTLAQVQAIAAFYDVEVMEHNQKVIIL
jgi:hypothetical protein